VGEIISSEGVLNIHNRWTAGPQKITLKKFYLELLLKQIELLLENNSTDFKDVPIIISGMASSSIGIEEQPYANIPFALDGKNAVLKFMKKIISYATTSTKHTSTFKGTSINPFSARRLHPKKASFLFFSNRIEF
jgi:2-dehydro-3-deoxygalactonokinase